MNKKLLHLIAVLVLVSGLMGNAALAATPPPAPASPEIPNSSISGVVTYEMGNPISGVTIQVSSGITMTTVTTDVYGSYVVPNLPDGTYTLTPVFGSYTFTPSSLTVTVPPDATNQNFVYIAPRPPNPKIFLPMLAKDLVAAPEVCPDFYDDFSNPASGWHVGEDQDYRSEYLNGEYRVWIKPVETFYLFVEPTCDRQNYSVEVYARWGGDSGTSYGLFFGMTGNYDHYYSFEVNSDYQEFTLWRNYPGGWAEIVPVTISPAIHTGNATNHLKATRNGSAITLEINGVTLGTWSDGNIAGPSSSGVEVTSYSDLPNADARFDNFKVISLGGSALVAGQDTSLEQAGFGLNGKEPLLHAFDDFVARFQKVKPIR